MPTSLNSIAAVAETRAQLFYKRPCEDSRKKIFGYLEIGTRTLREPANFSDVDLVAATDEVGFSFSRKNGAIL